MFAQSVTTISCLRSYNFGILHCEKRKWLDLTKIIVNFYPQPYFSLFLITNIIPEFNKKIALLDHNLQQLFLNVIIITPDIFLSAIRDVRSLLSQRASLLPRRVSQKRCYSTAECFRLFSLPAKVTEKSTDITVSRRVIASCNCVPAATTPAALSGDVNR